MGIEENKAAIRRMVVEVFNEGNLLLISEFYDSDFVWHSRGGVEIKGHEGVKQFITAYRNAFPDLTVTINDLVGEGDKVVIYYTISGTHTGQLGNITPTGKKVSFEAFNIISFVDGKQVESWGWSQYFDLFQQLGIIPSIQELGK